MRNHIYVGNLRGTVTEEALTDLFLPFGRVVKVVFPHARDNGVRRGFAFVTMGTPAEAETVLAGGADLAIGGRRVTLQLALEGWMGDRGHAAGRGAPKP